MDMYIALPRYVEGLELTKRTKLLWDANCISIGRSHDNPMFDTSIYDVEYLDGYKASLATNTMAENLSSQVDKEGNRLLLFEEIVDHRVYGKLTIYQDAFIF